MNDPYTKISEPFFSGGSNEALQYSQCSRSTARSRLQFGQCSRAGHSCALRKASKPGNPASKWKSAQASCARSGKQYRRPTSQPATAHSAALSSANLTRFHCIGTWESASLNNNGLIKGNSGGTNRLSNLSRNSPPGFGGSD